MTNQTTATTTTTKGVTFFEISGPDVDRLRTFYEEGIGLALADPMKGYTMIGAGDADAIEGGLFDGSGGPGTYAIAYVHVDDVDAAVERAVAAGATVIVAPFAHGPTRAAHIADPAGNRIGLFQPAS